MHPAGRLELFSVDGHQLIGGVPEVPQDRPDLWTTRPSSFPGTRQFGCHLGDAGPTCGTFMRVQDGSGVNIEHILKTCTGFRGQC